MDVFLFLFRDRAFEAQIPAFRRIVMTHEKAGLVGKGEKLLYRLVQESRIAAGKVTAGRTVVAHEQAVSHECGIPDNIGHAVVGMARRVQNRHLEVSDRDRISIRKKPVELPTIGTK